MNFDKRTLNAVISRDLKTCSLSPKLFPFAVGIPPPPFVFRLVSLFRLSGREDKWEKKDRKTASTMQIFLQGKALTCLTYRITKALQMSPAVGLEQRKKMPYVNALLPPPANA